VRGENVLLLGEIDLDKDDDPPPGFQRAELDVVKKLAEDKKAADKAKEKVRLKKLAKQGFEGENLGEIVF
jgi:U6 snRNA-associated Sm-like protein LSm1